MPVDESSIKLIGLVFSISLDNNYKSISIQIFILYLREYKFIRLNISINIL